MKSRKTLQERIDAFRAKGDRARQARLTPKTVSRVRRNEDGYAPGSCTVYFVQVGTDGPIKIGKTTASPLRRLDSLQIGIPFDLRLVAIIPCVAASTETELHRQFAHLHIRGEWFRPESDLLGYIQDHALPWTLTRDQIPGWWWGHFDVRNREMIEDSMKHPEMFRNDPMGGFASYEEYKSWREGRN